MKENQEIEKKSIRIISGGNPDWDHLARECVCFANAFGGKILIGIEDDMDSPPPNQKVNQNLPEKISKRIPEITLNVAVHPVLKKAENGGEYIELSIYRSAQTIASTTDGRYFMRISDECKPILPEDLSRLASEKNAYIWEVQTTRKIPRTEYDISKLNKFIRDVNDSDRVSVFVKNKDADELLDYYQFTNGNYLTNLGILWIGKRIQRSQLLFAPIVQFIKFDENDRKVSKKLWDDFSLNPKELIESIWADIPDWKEGIEISDGMFRKKIPNYDEIIVRELVANAIVHKPYTTRGDIFINLYPDRLEVHNPGLLPLGVTPANILHQSVKRNAHLAKIFYDLKIMEGEGSGFDRMYEVLLSNGKPVPLASEGNDRVVITVKKNVIRDELVRLMDKANQYFQLRPKEIISFGLIAQHNALSAIEFSKILGLNEPNSIRNWMGRLIENELIQSKGKTKGKEYFVNAELLRKLNYKGRTNLKKIETHRLRELIRQDLSTYKKCSIGEIHNRIGPEISLHKIRKALNQLIKDGVIYKKGNVRWTRYFLSEK
jgi:ATP-dependent DNA helicase RecG